jgi:hypothetical protein
VTITAATDANANMPGVSILKVIATRYGDAGYFDPLLDRISRAWSLTSEATKFRAEWAARYRRF